MVSRRPWKKQPAFEPVAVRRSVYFPARFVRAFSRQTSCGSLSGKGFQCSHAFAPDAKGSPTFLDFCCEPRATLWQRLRKETSQPDRQSCRSRRSQPFHSDKSDLPLRSQRSKRQCSQTVRAPPHPAGRASCRERVSISVVVVTET